MSKEFEDDVASLGGSGTPTLENVRAMRDHMKRRNQKVSVRPVNEALVAAGFDAKIATTGRRLRDLAGNTPPKEKGESPIQKAVKRQDRKRAARKTERPTTAPALTPELLRIDAATLIPTIADILKDASSTSVAIRENRVRMALNIVMAEAMAERAPALLLDMRGTAAMIDALTVAAKLSGGASIDISIPTGAEVEAAANGISPEGHPMRNITPAQTPSLVTEIARWKIAQKQNGQGT